MKNYVSLILLLCSLNIHAQDVIVPSFSFEHSTHVDAFVNVIKCESDGIEYVSILVFNESGKAASVGLEIELTDKYGNFQEITVPVFPVGFMEAVGSNCDGENDILGLRVPLKGILDKNSLDIQLLFIGL